MVFSHASPFHERVKLPERLYDLFDVRIKIKQQWLDDGKGGTSLGNPLKYSDVCKIPIVN